MDNTATKLRDGHIEFTREMKDEYTILIPNMAPIHFTLIKNVFESYGYKMILLRTEGRAVVDAGLKYVHNDTCYPALLVIGQFIDALDSGKYDLDKTALMITQTGGGCRASNYIHLLRKALKKAGYGQVPVVSLSLNNMEKNSGFKFTLPMIRKVLAALCYGDILMALDNQTKPYEVHKGQSSALVDRWTEMLSKQLAKGRGLGLKDTERNFGAIASDFAKIKRVVTPKVKVGIVGEIYVKYSSLGNNRLEEFLASQDCEVMVPGIMGFMMFIVQNHINDIVLYGGSMLKQSVFVALLKYMTALESRMLDAMKNTGVYHAPAPFAHVVELGKKVIGPGCKMGEGWLLTAEMMELAESGYGNIVCAQPFGCLPNHIVGKGMVRKIRRFYPTANIVPVDYDPGATKVNQENRIKLMLAVARERLSGGDASAAADRVAALSE